MNETPEDAVRIALEAWQGSERGLARDCGKSPSLFRLIRKGERSATRETCRVVADVMLQTAEDHVRAARLLRDAHRQEDDECA